MPRRIAFGEFELDSGTRQLLRDGAEVHLSPKAFDLLAALLAARPQAVSKDQLHTTLWKGAFVSDGNLSVLVAEVRRALGDEARAPRFVRTVQRFGYAFVMPIARVDSPPDPTPTTGAGWLLWGRRSLELPAGDLVIGRDSSCDVHLDLPGVSRRHARLRVTDTAVILEDLGSKNGTLRSGQRIEGSVILQDEDELRIGAATVVYRHRREQDSTATLKTATAPVARAKRPS